MQQLRFLSLDLFFFTYVLWHSCFIGLGLSDKEVKTVEKYLSSIEHMIHSEERGKYKLPSVRIILLVLVVICGVHVLVSSGLLSPRIIFSLVSQILTSAFELGFLLAQYTKVILFVNGRN